MSTSDPCGPELSGLIAHLYDAALDPCLWAGTAGRIAAAFGSQSTVLKLHGEDASVDLLECTANLRVPDSRREWAEDWHRRDLWVQRSVAFGMSRILTDADLVTPDEQRRSGFYREWLDTLGIHHMLGAVFPAAAAVGVLGIHRDREAGAYAEGDRRKAGVLLPHLQRALQVRQRLHGAAQAGQAALEALERLDCGVFVVDGGCMVVHANAMARALLRADDGLGLAGKRLLLRHPTLQQSLASLVRAAVDTARGGIAAAGASLALPRAGLPPLVLTVAPLRPSASDLGRQQPCALVFVRDPAAPVSVRALRDLFGLTRTEAAVAAELAVGRPLEDIARRLGVGLATVRSHLKQILLKTGTHRQAEAAALLARSVPLASGQTMYSPD